MTVHAVGIQRKAHQRSTITQSGKAVNILMNWSAMLENAITYLE